MMNKVQFSKEMKKTHTILLPNMLDIHFSILEKVLTSYGYKVKLLRNTDQKVVDTGLKYIHNDTCYPALLTCGQMISALQSDEFDVNKTALIMSQTGGGCRASNYIHLLRKALENAGMSQVPVISFNLSGLEKHEGFKLTIPLLRRCLAALVYGDLLMLLKNQTKPYEITKGETESLVEKWTIQISTNFEHHKGISQSSIKSCLTQIVSDFSNIKIEKRKIPKVGIVGEIYVKYSALANNNLERFLEEQDCEINVPGILSFGLYTIDANLEDKKLYGGSYLKYKVSTLAYNYVTNFETYMLDALDNTRYHKPASFKHIKELATPIIGHGCKMGEGWLLTAEMMELIENRYDNIICAQPFGCLPNHIVGKGMVRKILKIHPKANIVAIDYDPGATKVNQENRIKLMLCVAKEKLDTGEKYARV